MEYFELYPWQKKLANLSSSANQMMAMCANQIGKTTTGAAITAYHLTGKYPDDYTGHRFTKPIYAWTAGVSNDTTRDIIQSELFGLSDDEGAHGTGMVPKEDIASFVRRRGASGNSYDAVMVKHYTNGKYDGNSRIGFKSYEMGEEKFYGRPVDWIWLDEQPPDKIYTQCITRTVASQGLVLLTFTPEDGINNTVHQFMKERKPGQALLTATWDDAPHLTKARKDQLLAQYPPGEREMRSKGIPIFGSGLVFPISEDALAIDDFDIPDHWPMIAGLDFGWEHPTAVVWLRWDRDSDVLYITDCHRQNKATPIIHAAAINSRARCPVIWPHDGYQHDKGSGVTLADQYRQQNVNMTPQHFANPIAPGESGKGNNRIEPGISDMLQRMETGRFKVFKSQHEWFEEFRLYHRDEGKIVALRDDLMSATRYATQSLRYAEPPTGSSNYSRWSNKAIDYGNSNWIV